MPRKPSGTLRKLGKYELIARIGVGGMAEVYLARQRGPMNFEKVVVVKTIHPHLAQQQEFINMLLDEARISALLKHPRVVDIYDLGYEQDTYFIAMEYIPGQTLSKLMIAGRKRKRLDVYSTARIIADAADGLHAAHNLTTIQGDHLELVHRDVSPGNIIVGYDGNVKLVDFGVSKANGRLTITEVSQIKGKMGYVSPEQVKDLPVDRRSDIFSLGVVLWETLALTRLFFAQTQAGQMQKVLKGAIPTPSTVRREVPRDLDDICMRALERDVEKRYQSARDMKRDIEEFLAGASYYRDSGTISQYMTDMFGDKRAEEADLLRQVSRATAQIDVVIPDEAEFGDDSKPSGKAQVDDDDAPPVAASAPPNTKPGRSDSARQHTIHGVGPAAISDETIEDDDIPTDVADDPAARAYGDEVTIEEVDGEPSGRRHSVPLPLVAEASQSFPVEAIDGLAPAVADGPDPTAPVPVDDGATRVDDPPEMDVSDEQMDGVEDVEIDDGDADDTLSDSDIAPPVGPAYPPSTMPSDFEGLAREPGPGSGSRKWIWMVASAAAVAGIIVFAMSSGDDGSSGDATAGKVATAGIDAAPAVAIESIDATPVAAAPPDATPVAVAPPDAAPVAAAPPDAAPAKVPKRPPPKRNRPTAAERRQQARELYDDGFRRYMRGDLSGAKGKFKAAIKLDGRMPDAHRGLGLVFERQGDKAAAVKAFKRYLELRPNARDAAGIEKRIKRLGG